MIFWFRKQHSPQRQICLSLALRAADSIGLTGTHSGGQIGIGCLSNWGNCPQEEPVPPKTV